MIDFKATENVCLFFCGATGEWQIVLLSVACSEIKGKFKLKYRIIN